MYKVRLPAICPRHSGRLFTHHESPSMTSRARQESSLPWRGLTRSHRPCRKHLEMSVKRGENECAGNSPSGRSSPSPVKIALNERMVSLRSTSLPSIPVKTWATAKGWLRKRWILRARSTVSLSASDNSSIPRMAMISWSDLYSWRICWTRVAVS